MKIPKINVPGLKKKMAGLPPGTLDVSGIEDTVKTTVRLITFNESSYSDRIVEDLDELSSLPEKGSTNWIQINGFSDLDVLQEIASIFDIHRLIMEDILNIDHLPKAEEFGEFMYFTLQILQFNEASGAVEKNHINFILGKKVIISFAQKETPLFKPFIDRIEAAAAKVRTRKCDYILYRLIDITVDHYFTLFSNIDHKLELIEDSLVSEPNVDMVVEIQDVKKEILYLRRNIFPVAEAIRILSKDELNLFEKQTFKYINDTLDHLKQLTQILETSRENITSLMEMQMANNSNRMNEVMKTLTMIATIFIPLTFLAGIYGMNFAHMPELNYTWTYPTLLAVMLVTGVVMYIYMKRKRWF